MKKLMIVASMAILCIHSAAQEEEIRHLVREYVELVPELETPKERTDRRLQLSAALRAFELDEAYPVYYKILEENSDDPKYVRWMMMKFYDTDGSNLASYGRQEALDWARWVLRENKVGFDRVTAIKYLIQKGDERDIELIPSNLPSKRKPLEMRVAGTNVINFFQHPASNSVDWDGCLPSVTNTGPQALYVQAILRQVWNNLEIETDEWEPSRRFRDASKIPSELLTMVVWFDEDGNPVCNVDLSKYGLTMPEIDLPQNVKDEILRRARPNVATASLPSAEDETQRLEAVATLNTPPCRLWLYALIPLFLCAGAGLWFIRKKR